MPKSFACGAHSQLILRCHRVAVAFGATLSATPYCAQTPQGFSIVTPKEHTNKTENLTLKSQSIRGVYILFLVENPR